jgi:hypothetical protein
MTEVTTILIYIQFTVFVLIFLLALVYFIPIVFIRRFHNVNNVFTVNLCFAIICCDTYWYFYLIMANFFVATISNATSCSILNYFATMCTIQVPLAVVVVTIHRLCCIVYHTKPFFKRKQWATLCITSQWLTGIILSIARISFDGLVSHA